MSIDPNTGQIGWTPTVSGSYGVTVTALNTAGSDSQSFTIEVTVSMPCPTDCFSIYVPLLIQNQGPESGPTSALGNPAALVDVTPRRIASGSDEPILQQQNRWDPARFWKSIYRTVYEFFAGLDWRKII
jgi:PKD repeat protein